MFGFLRRLAGSPSAKPKPTTRGRVRSAATWMGGFEGARSDRTSEHWRPLEHSAVALHRMDGRTLRARARDLVANNPIAESAVSAYVSNVVGEGIRPRPMIEDRGRRQMITSHWRRWCGTGVDFPEADISELDHAYEIQGLWLREVIAGGGCLLRLRVMPKTNRRRVQAALELLPEERLADDGDTFVAWKNKRKSSNPIVGGVEIEQSTGRHLAYWITPSAIDDLQGAGGDPTRISAADCRYAFGRKRVGQHRGLTMFHAAVLMIWRLAYYTENEMISSAIKSCFAAFIELEDEGEDWPTLAEDTNDTNTTDAAGNAFEKVQPGTVMRGRKGEKISAIAPNTPSGDSSEWLQYLQRLICIAIDLSYEEVIRDYSKGNFSATRAAANADRRRFRRMQSFTINRFCSPVYPFWFRWATLAGLDGFPTPAQLSSDFDSWTDVNWHRPGWQSVNPYDDRRANEIELLRGLTSRRRLVEAGGEDLDEIDREREQDNDDEYTGASPEGVPIADGIRPESEAGEQANETL